MQQMGCPEGKTSSFSGSTSTGHRSTDDDSPAPRSSEDEDDNEVSGSHVETPPAGPVLKSTIGESVYDVFEVFSLPRVSDAASKRGLRGGWSLDLTSTCVITGRKWDFRRPGDRRSARGLVLRDRPQVLIFSPPCTLFSSLQRWSRYGPPEVRCPDRWAEAVAFVNFAIELCELQRRAGRGFVFEHPKFAASWTSTDLSTLSSREGVHEARLDM